MEWNKVSDKEIPFGEEVIAFNEKWIDEDFNPNGTRVGFMQDDGFISATWNNDDDCYDTCYEEGDMEASIGDYIIKCVNGEFYPCKPDIFDKTYEEVTE